MLNLDFISTLTFSRFDKKLHLPKTLAISPHFPVRSMLQGQPLRIEHYLTMLNAAGFSTSFSQSPGAGVFAVSHQPPTDKKVDQKHFFRISLIDAPRVLRPLPEVKTLRSLLEKILLAGMDVTLHIWPSDSPTQGFSA